MHACVVALRIFWSPLTHSLVTSLSCAHSLARSALSQYAFSDPIQVDCPSSATSSSLCNCGTGFTLYCAAYRYGTGDGTKCKCYRCDSNTTLYRTRYASNTRISFNTTLYSDAIQASEGAQPVCRSEFPIITRNPTDLWKFSTQSLTWSQLTQLNSSPGPTSIQRGLGPVWTLSLIHI